METDSFLFFVHKLRLLFCKQTEQKKIRFSNKEFLHTFLQTLININQL